MSGSDERHTAKTLSLDARFPDTWALSGEHEVAPSSVVSLPPRYRDVARIAGGAFGEVRRVLDTALERTVAMKILHPEVASNARIAARFVAEMKLTAGLSHPGIVAVHDCGLLDDGRAWFTMREVRGRTLREVIEETHATMRRAGSGDHANGAALRRLVSAFVRACEAVAYAHRRGVVHRDLKPDNIMVGELGEVLVMDWGLGRYVGQADAPADSRDVDRGSAQLTQHGDVLGTPAYMPPEQALGQRDLHGPPSDVYALGAILYHVLAGRPPYAGSAKAVLEQVIAGPPDPLVLTHARVPEALVAACARAMDRSMDARHPDAEALAREVTAWLDGVARRERALALTERANALTPKLAALRSRAAAIRAEVAAAMDVVKPFDPVAKKRPVWALEDEAAKLDVEAALCEADQMETLHGALTVDPDLPEAHEALGEGYLAKLTAAERRGDRIEAARAEAQLRAHDRGRFTSILRGDGAVTLVTDPPGAEVWAARYVLRDQRLVPEPMGRLGITPLHALPLPHGSYRFTVRASGRIEVTIPLFIERGSHADGAAPGDRDPYPILLPAEEGWDPDDVYVPAGYAWIGGEAGAAETLPLRRIWVDAFALRRFPVTNEEYLSFLDDLVSQGREEEALAACPRPAAAMPASPGERVYGRDAQGRFTLRAAAGDASERVWQPDWPVVLVDAFAAEAYAHWRSRGAEMRYRLPSEIEREKAARGADGRRYPWGDAFDATFACVLDSHEGPPSRASIMAYPGDESPYGVRGLAGNVRDFCEDAWTREGPEIAGDRLVRAPVALCEAALVAVRGGAWTSRPALSRAEARFASKPDMRWNTTGIRLARSIGEAR